MRCWACVAEKLLFHLFQFRFSTLKSTFVVDWEDERAQRERQDHRKAEDEEEKAEREES